MRPQFALSLSYEGITLYARASDDTWAPCGDVALSDPDMAGALAGLRKKAVAQAGEAFTTLLILPPDQALFTVADVPNDAGARDAIATQLEGRTPYDVSDLVFDWSGSGATRKVAAVALETLAEAEAFASEHRFNPVAFSVEALPGDFDGQPFFGECAGAQDLLDGATVARETGPFTIASTAKPAASSKPEATTGTAPSFSSRRPADKPAQNAETATDRLSRIKPRIGSATTAPPAAVSPAPAAPPRPKTIPPMPQTARTAFETTPTRPPDLPPAAEGAAAMALPGLPRAQQGKTNRLGLWLTLVLLVVMVLIGVLSLIAVPPGGISQWLGRTEPSIEQAVVPPDTPPDVPDAVADAVADAGPSAADLLPDSNDISIPQGGDFSAVALAPLPNELAPEPEPDVVTEEGEDIVLTDEDTAPPPLPTALEIVETYTSTGVWIGTPDAPEPAPEDALSALYETTLDIPIAHADAVALPSAAEQLEANPPRRYLPPPPAGTIFTVDDRGLVTPTPEGIVTPEGVPVIAGRPDVDVLPTPRPLADGPEPTQDATAPDDPQAALRAELARIPPRPRPDNFSDAIERAQNDGLTLAELRTPRPRERPQSVQEEARLAASVANAAAQAAQQASLAAPSGSASSSSENPGGIGFGQRTAEPPVRISPQSDSDLAIARSVEPRARPDDFARTVARQQEERRQQPAAAASTAVAAAPAAPRNATPRTLPSGSSVARAATENNVLRLRQVNLIGVFGKPSAPKALVRLRNGRTVRLGVGDRVDNGRVTSIGQGRLTYRKGGRDLVLEMPRI